MKSLALDTYTIRQRNEVSSLREIGTDMQNKINNNRNNNNTEKLKKEEKNYKNISLISTGFQNTQRK